ncbi:hypothetical protein L53_12140 [Hyphomonas sp. L-53-1-40]|uniref:hypothetical protein n=1 Tax=Hyphomonas sp. L-53-1-40 TaxID=1207058 RepID=UPI000458AE52|nr:hypothetical protein [Hyphomonas sp. L-53-1-40]KCZ62406.1 hypothetical protein L53_12140 [Hyphomonas sp. L-53-1-40]
MAEPDIIWDVYETPRLDAVTFGKYHAALDKSRPGILRGAKYNRRGHRASASDARGAMRQYLTSAFPNKGILDAHLDDYKKRLTDDSRSDEQHENDDANAENMHRFIHDWDDGNQDGKLLLPINSQQEPLNVGGVSVRIDLDCLIHSESKTGEKRVGGLFLNTQKGEGLGSKPDTIDRRDRAGNSVALLVLKTVADNFSSGRNPFPADCMHYYVRHKKIWHAPKSYKTKLADVVACGETAAEAWGNIQPPSTFDPARAAYHD